MSTLRRISITTIAAFVLGAVRASAGELPQYEFEGFPISPHQISVLGAGGIQEQSPTPTLTFDGMPASQHQIAVIGPLTKKQIAEKLNRGASGDSSQTTN